MTKKQRVAAAEKLLAKNLKNVKLFKKIIAEKEINNSIIGELLDIIMELESTNKKCEDYIDKNKPKRKRSTYYGVEIFNGFGGTHASIVKIGNIASVKKWKRGDNERVAYKMPPNWEPPDETYLERMALRDSTLECQVTYYDELLVFIEKYGTVI